MRCRCVDPFYLDQEGDLVAGSFQHCNKPSVFIREGDEFIVQPSDYQVFRKDSSLFVE